jgi:hypothetical protein
MGEGFSISRNYFLSAEVEPRAALASDKPSRIKSWPDYQ